MLLTCLVQLFSISHHGQPNCLNQESQKCIISSADYEILMCWTESKVTLMIPTSWCSHPCVIPFSWVWAGHVTCFQPTYLYPCLHTLALLVGNGLSLPSSDAEWHRAEIPPHLSHILPFGPVSFLAPMGVLIWSIHFRNPMLSSLALSAPCFCTRAPNHLKYPLWRFTLRGEDWPSGWLSC